MKERRHAVFWVFVALTVALGLWIRRPVIQLGFHNDDTAQIGMLRDRFPAERSAFDLFRFADGARDGKKLINYGYHPWWTQPDLRIAFFRPLTSGLIALDHRLFGVDARFYHVQSLFWWAALVVAAALLLKRVVSMPVALLTVALFAFDESHVAPSAWIANRSTLVATTFGVLAVWAHVRYRQTQTTLQQVIEGALWALALLAGEYGVAMLGYLVAYELLGVKGTLRERWNALFPSFAVASVYLILRSGFAFGVRGSGYYLSAFNDPWTFLEAAVGRLPALFGDLVFSLPAAWYVLGTPWHIYREEWRDLDKWQTVHLSIGLVALLLLVLLGLWLAWRSSERNRSLRWLVVGTVFSVVPFAAALPEDRLLVAAAIGATAVFVSLGVEAVAAWRIEPWKRAIPAKTTLVALGAAALVLHGYYTFEFTRRRMKEVVGGVDAQRQWALRAEIPDAGIESTRVLIISAADFTTGANLPWVRFVHGHPLPKSYWRMSGSTHVHEIQRVGPNVIELATLSSDIDDSMVGSLYRSAELPIRVGDRVDIDGALVEVLATSGDNPWRTRFTFDRPLDDGTFLFLHSMPDGLKRIELPRVGKRLRLPRPQYPKAPQ